MPNQQPNVLQSAAYWQAYKYAGFMHASGLPLSVYEEYALNHINVYPNVIDGTGEADPYIKRKRDDLGNISMCDLCQTGWMTTTG
eukprot:2773538-Pyramimonas_sp.AAC.1